MAYTIEITQLSPTMKEGILVEWLKKEGELVAPGDVIASIETDKAVMDLESFEEGILLSRTAEASSRLPVGAPIGIIGEANEDITELLEEVKSRLSSTTSGLISEPNSVGDNSIQDNIETPILPTRQETEEQTSNSEDIAQAKTIAHLEPQPTQEKNKVRKIKASPLAKKLASIRKVPLESIQGSGPGGRIVKRDVEAVHTQQDSSHFSEADRKQDQIVSLSMMRQSIAKRLTESKSLVPHFYLSREIQLEELTTLRKEINEDLQAYHGLNSQKKGLRRPPKLSVNDFIIRANALALAECPDVNAQWNQDSIILKGNVDIAVAVAVEDGLITPVIRNASHKNIFQLSLEIKELAKKSHERKLKLEEFTGGTFTISNLGMYDIDSFIAILNPPEAALMAVGKSTIKPHYDPVTEEFVPKSFLSVTLSCDHRVVDGAKGAEYLKIFAFLMERPRLLI